MIQVSSPEVLVEESIENVRNVLESGQLAQGPFVQKSEELLSNELSAEYSSMIVNGTSSLKAAICAGVAAVGGGGPEHVDRKLSESEVIVPAFSFNATLNAPLQLGTTARLVDVDAETFCMDPEAVAEAITDRTAAVVPVDLYGQAADTRSIQKDLTKNQIALIRDSAQAHGAQIDGQSIVGHGDALSLSFYATKNVNAGEGGAVVTNNEDIDSIVKMYRNQGMRQRYDYAMIGENLRMSDLHAAILVTQLGKIAAYTEVRQKNAEMLSERLRGVEGLTLPKTEEGLNHVFHQYTVMVEKEFGMSRDDLAGKLAEKGVGTGVYYPAVMIEHATYKDHPRIKTEDISVSRKIASKVLSLPVHTKLTEENIEHITNSIIDIRNKQ